MKSRKEIFNELISPLVEFKSVASKKDLFLQNIDYVKKLLQSGLSIQNQIENYNNEVEKISRSGYEKYCKEFLKEEYEQGLLNTLFFRNIKTIAYYLTNNENPKTSEIYTYLLNNGSLKKARNKKDSSLDYDTFLILLKEFLNNKGYKDIIEYDNLINLNSENIPTSTQINKLSSEIKIELIDNSFETFNIDYLKNNFIEYENSYIDNNIKEKNVYYIQSRYIDKEYDFDEFKNIIKKENLIEEYSIIIHNNSSIDTRLYIYRFIDNELILLKDLDALSCVFELDELIRRSRKNFFEKFGNYMDKLIL